MTEFIVFDRDSLLKNVIKEQGDIICRGQIYQEIIDDALKNFTIGFANVIEKAQQGKKRQRKADRIQVTSFSLLSVFSSSTIYKELYIILICNTKNRLGEGSELISHIIDYAKENKYSRLSLLSLNEKSLLDWYLQHGFKIIQTIYQGSEVKAIKLAIDFNFEQVTC